MLIQRFDGECKKDSQGNAKNECNMESNTVPPKNQIIYKLNLLTQGNATFSCPSFDLTKVTIQGVKRFLELWEGNKLQKMFLTYCGKKIFYSPTYL